MKTTITSIFSAPNPSKYPRRQGDSAARRVEASLRGLPGSGARRNNCCFTNRISRGPGASFCGRWRPGRGPRGILGLRHRLPGARVQVWGHPARVLLPLGDPPAPCHLTIPPSKRAPPPTWSSSCPKIARPGSPGFPRVSPSPPWCAPGASWNDPGSGARLSPAGSEGGRTAEELHVSVCLSLWRKKLEFAFLAATERTRGNLCVGGGGDSGASASPVLRARAVSLPKMGS